MPQKPALHFTLRSYSHRERVEALIKAAEHEGEEASADLLVALIYVVQKLSWRFPAKCRGNVGMELSRLAISLRRSSVRVVRSAAPIKVTKYPTTEQRSA